MKRILFFIFLSLLAAPVYADEETSVGGHSDLYVGKEAVYFSEKASDPSSPSANNLKLYAKDKAGTTTLYTKDSAGTVTEVGAGGGAMVYPGAGIALSTGAAWDTSIANNSSNWNTAYGWGDHSGAGYAILAGAAGGQTLLGGTGASENLTLGSTAHATKGKILFGASAYDEVNERLGVGTASPTTKLHLEAAIGAGISNAFKGIRIGDTTSTIAGVGGGFAMYGAYTGTTQTVAATIKAAKTNSTSGNYSFNLLFGTRLNGVGNVTENMVLADTGNLGIGLGAAGIPLSRIHGVTTLSADTGDEIAYQLNYTTNKLTSGNDTGLLINQTDTASPGTSLLADFQVGSASKFSVSNVGNLSISGDLTITGDDLFMNTNTSGAVLVADGTNFNPVVLSGDASISTAGVLGVNKTRLNVRNETGVQIASTKAVYVSGFNNFPLIALADNTDETKHGVIGVTVAPINHEANGFIATNGQCDAETNTWTVGDKLYLSTSGSLTNVLPTSGAVKIIGIVTVQQNYPDGKILIEQRQEEHTLAGGSATDLILRTGDSSGVNKISFRDYSNAEVAFISSDGIIGDTTNRLPKLWATDITVTNAIDGSVTGNSGTATALAANGANCDAGNYPLGVDASGASEGCTAAPTQASLSVDDLITLSGVAEGSTHLGTFTGTTIADNQTIKAGLQALETSVETKDSVITAGRSLTRTTNDIAADAELYTDFKSITIESPTDADNIFFFEAPIALTVTRVTGIVESATSAVLTVQECDSAGDNCSTVEAVTADVDGTVSTSIDNASIDAGDIVRLDVGTVTGTVGQAHLTVTFTKDD